MGGAYGSPCVGELEFWATTRSQMNKLVEQTRRIADALEERNRLAGGSAGKGSDSAGIGNEEA